MSPKTPRNLEETMRTLLVPICFMLAMPFCCGLVETNANAAIETADAADPAIPPGSAQTRGGKLPQEKPGGPVQRPQDLNNPQNAVAAAKCVVDDGDSTGPDKDPPVKQPPKTPKGPKLPDQPHEDDKTQHPGTEGSTAAMPKPTPPSPSPSPSSSAPSSSPSPTIVSHATVCEAKMSDSCETFCEDRDSTWDSNAGSHDGTCFKLSPMVIGELTPPTVKCGCMCI
jgi:hypothetical protein